MRNKSLPSFSNPHITFFRDYLFLVTLSEIFYFFSYVGICVCSFFFLLQNNCHIKARTYISWFPIVVVQSWVVSDSLQPHGLQHTRPPCPSPSSEICPSSHPLHWWCHADISFSDTLFSFCPQCFPASGTFPMSRLFAPDDQSTIASASVLPTSIQGWFLLRLTGLISLLSKGLSGVFSSTTVQRHQFFGILPFFTVQLSKPYVTTGKNLALIIQTFVGRVMSLIFKTLFRLVIVFLPRSNCLPVSWL